MAIFSNNLQVFAKKSLGWLVDDQNSLLWAKNGYSASQASLQQSAPGGHGRMLLAPT
jgi:hypothetical protein